MFTRFVVVLLMTLLVSACGGDDGGGSQPPSLGFNDVRSSNPSATSDTSARAAGSLPRFGSVTQSSNRDGSGVSTDAASTSFDGTNIRLTVSRAGGGLTLDSRSHRLEVNAFRTPVRGHTGRTYALLDYTSSSISAAVVAVSASSAADYLAGGYWLYMRGDVNARRITGVEAGAFVDGPELSGTPTLPSLGRASYRGPAAGLYTYTYGSGRSEPEIGEFLSTVTLTADFGAKTVSGCIGCAGGATLEGVSDSGSGEVDVHIYLGAARLNADGAFSNRDVSVELRGRNVQTRGSWGGAFSSIQDGAGDPRLVGGTAGAEWTEPDGSRGVVVGTYIATKN